MQKKYVSYFLQLLALITIYWLVETWQTRNLLPDNGELSSPDFSLVGLDEKIYTLSKAKKVPTIIYFFAPWCKICHYSIPNLQILRESKSEKKLNIFVIALDWKTKTEIMNYVKQHKLTMPVLLGTRETMQDFKVEAFPTYYRLDAEQKITKVSVGYSTEIGLRVNSL